MRTVALATIIAFATPVAAQAEFTPLYDEAEFLSLIQGKELSNRLLGISLTVSSDGRIQGDALGWEVTGSWDWTDGYFCREMNWGGDPIPFNCQLVEVRNGNELRFTVDQGAGDSARFRLR